METKNKVAQAYRITAVLIEGYMTEHPDDPATEELQILKATCLRFWKDLHKAELIMKQRARLMKELSEMGNEKPDLMSP